MKEGQVNKSFQKVFVKTIQLEGKSISNEILIFCQKNYFSNSVFRVCPKSEGQLPGTRRPAWARSKKSFQKNFKAVSKSFQNFKAVSKSFQKNFKAVSKSFQKNFKAVSKSFQKNFRAVSKSFQNSKAVSKSFQVRAQLWLSACCSGLP